MILNGGGVFRERKLPTLGAMDMTHQRWRYTNAYTREVFGVQDEHLAGLMADAVAHGLPDIAVSADVGRLLLILTAMTRGRLAIELGTLGGYSAIWIARGLGPGGRLITIEKVREHADFARQQFARAGLDDRIELRCGDGLTILRQLVGELPPRSVDVVFLDADKEEYPDYWQVAEPLIGVGGLILCDNALGSGRWWIDDFQDPARNAADRFNRLVAAHADFESVAVPLREGVLIGRRFR